jgi:hypothetical protein
MVAEQADLFAIPSWPDINGRHLEAWWRFHCANPHVYAKLVEIAGLVHDHGKKRFGMAAIFERLRWWAAFEVNTTDYKLNNNFRSYYARLVAQNEPHLADLFETRSSPMTVGSH